MFDDGRWRHLCVDMQRMFAEDTPWCVPWLARVLPQIGEVSGRFPEQTIFTQFMPPQTPNDAPGRWQAYYQKWQSMTGEVLPASLLEIVEPLARFIPPARTFAKNTYSPWVDGRLHAALQARAVNTIVVTGGETDVCVLATILGAIDHGYRVIALHDAMCGSADETHDASLTLLGNRFSVQLELMSVEDFLRMT